MIPHREGKRSLLVVSYPTILEEDFEWIQSIRKQHDEINLEVIDPHFTIIFPVFGIEEKVFVNHVKQAIPGIQAFDFTIRCAVLGNDAFSDYTHVFLVPDQGYSNIIKLHDRLYKGLLANELRLDIPFVPHIGIANSLDPQTCKHIADKLNATSFEIRGRVELLDLIWDEGNKIGTIDRVNLDSKLR